MMPDEASPENDLTAMGVYDWRDGERLPVVMPDETSPENGLAAVAQISVE